MARRKLGRNLKKDHAVTIRLSDVDMIQIRKRAERYCNGCVSEWMRYAASHLFPFKSDIDPKKRERYNPNDEQFIEFETTKNT